MDGQHLIKVVLDVSPSHTPVAQTVGVAASILLGLGNVIWNLYLSRKTRSRSVDDDFWFRKVVAPSVIDKSLEFSSKWSAALSGAQSVKGDGDAARAEIVRCKAEAETVILGCLCLKLYSSELFKAATGRIDNIVDEVTECYYAVSSTAIIDSEINRVVSLRRNSMAGHVLELLRSLRSLQSSF